jgi:16S rRNA G966 N2-methylase RsmD
MSQSNHWINQLKAADIHKFIIENADNDISILALKKNPFPEFNYTDIINQIDARKRAKYKLSTWFNQTHIIYPTAVSLQQSSSELTAKYKSTIVSGIKGIDLTAGFGIDSYFFSQVFQKFICIEKNENLSAIIQHNYEVLGIDNILVINEDSSNWLYENEDFFDLIYIDPARRDQNKKKVFRFEDCEPQILDNFDFYLSKSERLLIKTSPLLDISLALAQLKFVKEIHIVAIANEVKELLFLIENKYESSIKVHLVDLIEDSLMSFDYHHQMWSFDYALPSKYLFVPHATLMKIGQFDGLKEVGNLFKLHPHSHLFTSNETIKNFFGKSFKINEVLSYQKNMIKPYLFNKKLNISCRNFPLKPEELRVKWKIKDGGEDYVFFTTNHKNEKIVLFCTKL